MAMSLFISILIFVTWVCLCIEVRATTDDKIQFNVCGTTNTEQRRCIPFSECKSLYKLINTKPVPEEIVEYLRKAHCGFKKSEPKVCCSLSDNINDPTLPVASSALNITSKPGIGLPGLDTCGLSPVDRLVGIEAPTGAYPWLALLQYKKPNGDGFHCGGALISSQYVLTAAHCVSDIPEDWSIFSVRLGEHDMAQDPDCEEFLDIKDCAPSVFDIAIETTIVHKDYKPNDTNKYNDIALLRLVKPITFSEFISPICLPHADQDEVADHIQIAGWRTSKTYEARGVKKHSTISSASPDKCHAAYQNDPHMQLRDDQFCLAKSRKYQSICNIDNGGPLMAISAKHSRFGNYFALGVLSVSSSICCPDDFLSSTSSNCSVEKPVVATKAVRHLGWIIENIKA